MNVRDSSLASNRGFVCCALIAGREPVCLRNGPFAGRCPLPRAKRMLAGLRNRDTLFKKADDGHWPKAIWELPV